MAKSVWLTKADLEAFAAGKAAAQNHKPRTAPAMLLSYNEKAAFNDGWDTAKRALRQQPAAQRQRSASA